MYPSKVQETPMMQERKYENWRCETSGGSGSCTSFTAIASFTMMMINSELSATNFCEFIP